MNESISAISVEEIYGDNGMTDEKFYSRLDQSLNPRGSSVLYDKVAAAVPARAPSDQLMTGYWSIRKSHTPNQSFACWDRGASLAEKRSRR
jgi:hypothetical protein